MNWYLFGGVILVIGIIYLLYEFSKTGFGKGKMKIELNKSTFNFGEAVIGKLIVSANKNIDIKSITIEFACFRKIRSQGKTIGRSDVLFKRELELAENVSFCSKETKEFAFDFSIPKDQMTKTTTNQTVNSAVGLITNRGYRVFWKITGRAKISKFVKIFEHKKIEVY